MTTYSFNEFWVGSPMGDLRFGGGFISSILIGWPTTKGTCMYNQNFTVRHNLKFGAFYTLLYLQ